MTEWVKARSQCSPSAVFEKLKSDIENDVEVRNGLCSQGDGRFNFSVTDNNVVQVSVEKTKVAHKGFEKYPVVVSLRVDGNEIVGTTRLGEFRATLTLNEEQKCRLKVDGIEHEFWRVRQKLLEDLFFNIA